ncbi:MAG: sigma 54-interacting transcriptional regulator, partial [Alphaproteobacteria bacterium]|nr:sigma 54-interacting transcriptional regulator [Alphaproteobacteria bacterium]
EQAEGGTLFLDEIGDMPVEAQTRLLRVLQQGEYSAVGGQDVRKTDVRILCATNRDLKAMVAAGTFREDLFYRLNVVPLHVPPLRERREDIPALAEHFLMRAEQKGLPRKTLSPDAVRLLMAHSWPGNVRELENLIYRLAALTTERQIPAYAVSAELPGVGASAGADTSHSLAGLMAAHLRRYFAALDGDEPAAGLYQTVIEEVEKPLIEQVLEYTGGNQIRAAEVLGINRNTLRKKIQELGIAVLKQ